MFDTWTLLFTCWPFPAFCDAFSPSGATSNELASLALASWIFLFNFASTSILGFSASEFAISSSIFAISPSVKLAFFNACLWESVSLNASFPSITASSFSSVASSFCEVVSVVSIAVSFVVVASLVASALLFSAAVETTSLACSFSSLFSLITL